MPDENDAVRLFRDALAHHQAGRLEAAAEGYQAALDREPVHLGAAGNLATVLATLGRQSDAEAVYERALAHHPGSAALHSNYGGLLRAVGRPAAAEERLRRALDLAPDLEEALLNLGLVLNDQGRPSEALEPLRRAVQRNGANGEAHYGLALALRQDSDSANAEVHFRRAAELLAGDARPWVGLAACRLEADDFDGAISGVEEALNMDDANADAWTLKGVTHREQGRLDDAISAYDQAISIAPRHAEARYNRGVARLSLADLPDAWEDYAWRWECERRAPPWADLELPLWDGRPLDGRRIVLVAEQGFGDAMQFVRFAKLVAACGGPVTLRAPTALHRLLKTCDGVDSVIDMAAAAPDATCYAPLMELPGILQTDLRSIPAADGYLSAPFVASGDDDGIFHVGLIWAGSPGHPNDRHRSLNIAAFSPLLDVSKCQIHSLQLGAQAVDLASSERFARLDNAVADVEDFADTAAVLAGLDLLITVDTAAAHLAGALGFRAWVLLPFVADWRWMTERTDSPWYRSLTLYRQPRRGDWNSVMDDVAADLRALIDAEETS